jgi:hypothetical protein
VIILELVPLIGPRHLDSISFIFEAISLKDQITMIEIEQYTIQSGFEFNDSISLLLAVKAIKQSDGVIKIISHKSLIEIIRSVILLSSQYNETLRNYILQIGIYRKGNYLRNRNVDQMLRNSNLYDIMDEKVFVWWFQLRELSRENKSKRIDSNNPNTGFQGELLTYDFEKNRLRSTDNIQWLSLVSDNYGYDIKSQRDKDGQDMLIEVKSSVMEFDDAKFYLTQNEYSIMVKNIRKYVFYLWWNVKEKSGTGPLIIDSSVVAEKLASLIKNNISFSDCLIIPFSNLISDVSD